MEWPAATAKIRMGVKVLNGSIGIPANPINPRAQITLSNAVTSGRIMP